MRISDMSTLSNIEYPRRRYQKRWLSNRRLYLLFFKVHKVVPQGYPSDEAGTENTFRYSFALMNSIPGFMYRSDYDSLKQEIYSLGSTKHPNPGRSLVLYVPRSLQQSLWHMSPCLPMFPILLPSASTLFVSKRLTNAKGSASRYWRSISIG